MNNGKKIILAVAIVFGCAGVLAASAAETRIQGEKLDSGLGELPHYREWAQHPHLRSMTAMVNHVPGEKLDSGLGDMPPYREWARVRTLQRSAARDVR
jgi:hypothetical protein